jgi:hypothetical protein
MKWLKGRNTKLFRCVFGSCYLFLFVSRTSDDSGAYVSCWVLCPRVQGMGRNSLMWVVFVSPFIVAWKDESFLGSAYMCCTLTWLLCGSIVCSLQPETGKRVAETVLKTSAYNKKAKIATPSGGQKTGTCWLSRVYLVCFLYGLIIEMPLYSCLNRDFVMCYSLGPEITIHVLCSGTWTVVSK